MLFTNTIIWKTGEFKRILMNSSIKEEELTEFIELMKEKNIKLVIIMWDTDHENDGELAFPFEFLFPLLRNYNVPFYDFSKYLPNPGICPSPTRLPDCHLSALGYEIVSNKTLEIINELVVKLE